MWNARLDEAQAGIKIAGRNVKNLRYADDTTLMAESEEGLKNLLMKIKEESKKVGLKLNIQKMKIMASGPIISWQIGGETIESVIDFILGGSKITADCDCSHEIKRHLLLARKAMTKIYKQLIQLNARKTSTSVSLTMWKSLTAWITTNCGKLLKRREYQTTLPASSETCMQVRKQRLELDMQQQIGSKLGKE